MFNDNQKKRKKIMAAGFLLFVFLGYGFSLVIVNESENGFEGQEKQAMRGHVIEGAGYFLASYSDMLLFSREIELVEMQGADYGKLQAIIANAVANIENAGNHYTGLTQKADISPYNQEVITELINYDYTFCRESRSLNSVIFSEVESYLNCGDIRGLYYKLQYEIQEILNTLAPLRASVEAEALPQVKDLWEANQDYSRILLFGQYTAEIFCDIVGK